LEILLELLEPLIAFGPLLLAKFVALLLLANEGTGDLSAVALYYHEGRIPGLLIDDP
jgi:hypothetical protein